MKYNLFRKEDLENLLNPKIGIEPQKKYNIKLNASTDFRVSSDTGWESEISGEYFKLIHISSLKYKFFYAPTTVLEIYFLTESGELKPAYQNMYIPLGKIKDLVLVRPSGLSSGSIYFQFWLSNLESIEILDVYEELFDITALQTYGITPPFPTYQMKFLFKCPIIPTSYDLEIKTHPVGTFDKSLNIEDKASLTDIVVNNVYEYNLITGSGVTATNPHYPFPSFLTDITIKNNDGAVTMSNCWVKIVSYEKAN